jgi:hypothetical protein
LRWQGRINFGHWLSGVCEAWVGSGREDIDDGTGLFAALAQPSGLARSGDWLYFVDSEVSALRRANLKTQNVETLIGSGLFDFGYKDGSFASALLQHPLGVAVHNEILVTLTAIVCARWTSKKIVRLREMARRMPSPIQMASYPL